MGKRVNLNEDRNNSSTKEPSALRKKVAVIAATKMGVPKELAEEYVNNPKLEKQANSVLPGGKFIPKYDEETGKIVIKLPLTAKIALIMVAVLSIIIFLMIFVVLFGNESTTKNVNARYALGQTCEQISVYSTENSQYDSNELSFYDYLTGVVAAESEGSTDLEYLKLLAVVSRTYFLANATSRCEVKGNSEFQKYMDANNSPNRNLVEQAVTETQDLIIVENDDLINSYYCQGCIVNADNDYYYLRYNSTEIQKISRNWANTNGLTSELDELYSQVDISSQQYENRNCPSNNSDMGMSKIGAQYLLDNEPYTYESTIKYYFGQDVEIIKNEIIFSENGEFINPVSAINCTSLYGKRIHPVTGAESYHSGIDLGISGGSPVYAAKSGTISMVSKNITITNGNPQDLPGNASYGNYIVIDHGDGISTLYAHMKYGSIPETIQTGDTIEQGDKIGEVGSTGVSTGNHLHYEVRKDGSTVDPIDYLDLTDATGYCAN